MTVTESPHKLITQPTLGVAKVASLYFDKKLETIDMDAVRATNAQANCFDELVVVFVGGTAGIGETTARELFRHARRPRLYIVGRNEDSAVTIMSELSRINPDGQAFFLPKDISLLQSVDEVCAELQQREQKIHCLFLTAGYMSLEGRRESAEGLDRKMAVNYYSRMRFIHNLMPQLTAAAVAGELSRVNSVLAAGSEGDVDVDDLDLKHNFTVHACLAHCVVMTDFIVQEFAKRFPGTSFCHSYPGTVKTGIANMLSGPVRLAVKVMYAVMTPWILDVQESGERHFFQMISGCYPAAAGGGGIPPPETLEIMTGADGQQGSGSYILDWDGKPAGDEHYLRKYREQNLGPKVWDHTMAMFAQAQQKASRQSNGYAESEPDRSNTATPSPPFDNPVGWRAG